MTAGACGDVVLFVIQKYPDGGGISSILETFCGELSDRFRVHVAIVEALPGFDVGLGLPSSQIHVLGYSNLQNPLLFPGSIVHTIRLAFQLRRLVGALRPAVVITKDALNLPIPALAATAGRSTSVVITDHGTLTNVHDPAWVPMLVRRMPRAKGLAFRLGYALDRPWRGLRWRLALDRCDAALYVGDELEPWFARAGSRARRYSQSIPAEFVPMSDDERSAIRRDLGVDEDEVLVSSIGRLDGEKGLDLLVAAIDHAARRPSRFAVLIAGDGSLREWLVAEISRRGLSDVARLVGRLSRADVKRLHGASDLHVYAGTMSCGISICVLEAMASAVAPLVSDVPKAQRRLVGSAGWVVRANDAEALAEALADAVASGRASLASVGRKARARLEEREDPTFGAVLEELLGERVSGAAFNRPVVMVTSTGDASGVASYVDAYVRALVGTLQVTVVAPVGSYLLSALPANATCVGHSGSRRALTAAVRRGRADRGIVVTHGARALLAARLARVPRRRLCHVFHADPALAGVRGRLEVALSAGIDIAANGPSLRRSLEQSRHRLVHEFPCIVDEVSYAPREAERAALGVTEALVFGVVGRLHPIKRTDLAIRAFAALPDDVRGRAVLVVIGAGPERMPLQAAAAGLNIVFLGHRDHAERSMRAFDVFVAPSPHETFGYGLAFAVLAGVPVAVVRSGGAEALSDDGRLFPLCSPTAEALSAGMSAAIDRPGSDGDAAREWLAMRFSRSAGRDAVLSYLASKAVRV